MMFKGKSLIEESGYRPYRALATAIIKQAVDDYLGGNMFLKRDATRFFKSKWCKNLCDGIDIDYGRLIFELEKRRRMKK